MFERFTASARDVVIGAQREAKQLKHRTVGTEHLLLALLATEDPTGAVLRDSGLDYQLVRAEVLRLVPSQDEPFGEQDAAALKAIGIDVDAVRAKLEESFGPGALDPPPQPRRGWFGRSRTSKHHPFSQRAKVCLELALREALRLKHNYIGTEHLLLGLVREGRGLAAKVINDTGVDLEQLRQRMIEAIEARSRS